MPQLGATTHRVLRRKHRLRLGHPRRRVLVALVGEPLVGRRSIKVGRDGKRVDAVDEVHPVEPLQVGRREVVEASHAVAGPNLALVELVLTSVEVHVVGGVRN